MIPFVRGIHRPTADSPCNELTRAGFYMLLVFSLNWLLFIQASCNWTLGKLGSSKTFAYPAMQIPVNVYSERGHTKLATWKVDNSLIFNVIMFNDFCVCFKPEHNITWHIACLQIIYLCLLTRLIAGLNMIYLLLHHMYVTTLAITGPDIFEYKGLIKPISSC